MLADPVAVFCCCMQLGGLTFNTATALGLLAQVWGSRAKISGTSDLRRQSDTSWGSRVSAIQRDPVRYLPG